MSKTIPAADDFYCPAVGMLYRCVDGGFLSLVGTVDNATLRMRFYNNHPLHEPRTAVVRTADLSRTQVHALIYGNPTA